MAVDESGDERRAAGVDRLIADLGGHVRAECGDRALLAAQADRLAVEAGIEDGEGDHASSGRIDSSSALTRVGVAVAVGLQPLEVERGRRRLRWRGCRRRRSRRRRARARRRRCTPMPSSFRPGRHVRRACGSQPASRSGARSSASRPRRRRAEADRRLPRATTCRRHPGSNAGARWPRASSKVVIPRCRAMKSSGQTRLPTAISSFSDPTEQTESTRSQPASRRDRRFAAWSILWGRT